MRATTSMLTPNQKRICAAVGISETAYLHTYAREQIGRPRTFHGEREAHFLQLTEGKDGEVRSRTSAAEGEPSEGDDSLDSHVSRACNHLSAMDDEDTDAAKMARLQLARASIDKAIECFKGGVEPHSISFHTYSAR